MALKYAVPRQNGVPLDRYSSLSALDLSPQQTPGLSVGVSVAFLLRVQQASYEQSIQMLVMSVVSHLLFGTEDPGVTARRGTDE
jgi:hypothetical protein